MTSAFRKLTAVAAVVMGIALIPVIAPAYMGGDGPVPSGQHFKKMASELGLSPEQKQAIKDLFKKNKPLAEPLMKQMFTERRALRTLIQADPIDETAIRAQSAKVAAIEADLAVQRAHGAQEFRKVLTPEQIQKLKTIQDKRDLKREKFSSRGDKNRAPIN